MSKEPKKISSQVSEVNSETTLKFEIPVDVLVVMSSEAEYTIHGVVQMRPFSIHDGCVGFKIDQDDGSVTIVPPGYCLMTIVPRESK